MFDNTEKDSIKAAQLNTLHNIFDVVVGAMHGECRWIKVSGTGTQGQSGYTFSGVTYTIINKRGEVVAGRNTSYEAGQEVEASIKCASALLAYLAVRGGNKHDVVIEIP